MNADGNNLISQPDPMWQHPDLTPRPGDLLISKPMLHESVFTRSVIYMLDTDAGDADERTGSMGLVLNNPTSLSLNTLFPDWDEGKRVPLYLGGPVELDRLFMLHKLGNVFGKAVHIADDIYVGGDLELLKEYVRDGGEVGGMLRVFLGYSGWAHQQLEDELKEKSWLLEHNPDTSDLFLGEGNAYWRREVERLGEAFRRWLVVPEDPLLN